jgi:P27 family predicted phage terminase small subunit
MRPRKSVEEKLLKGTFRKDRESPPDLSAPLEKLPPAPARLSKPAQAAWKRIGAAAIQIGSLRRSDLEGLELVAAALGTAAEAEEIIRREGMVIASPTGTSKPNPAVAILQASRAQVDRMLQRFGLSPVSRARVGAKRPAQLPPMSSFSRPTLVSPVFDDDGRPMTLREFLEADGKGPAAKK